MSSLAGLTMPKKKPKGRPRGAGPMEGRYVVPRSKDHGEWMEGFMEKLGEVEIADAIREALRRCAAEIGYDPPPKR